MVSIPTKTDPVIAELYRMIRIGDLAPGEHIDQRTIAERLSVSRSPLREALSALESDGLLVHSQNRGYTVAKLGKAELLELYALRTYVEDSLVISVVWPPMAQMKRLNALNRACVAAAVEHDIEAMNVANRNFYFAIYEWSPLRALYREAERLWRMSEPYRAAYLSDPLSSQRLGESHGRVIEAVMKRDKKLLIELMDAQRNNTRTSLLGTLQSSVSIAHRTLPQSARTLSETFAQPESAR